MLLESIYVLQLHTKSVQVFLLCKLTEYQEFELLWNILSRC